MERLVDLTRISTVPLSTMRVDEPFFDSLRADYREFDEWYARVAHEGRKAWIVASESVNIAALCVYKVEAEGEWINDDGETLPDRFLKLCTFKVQDVGIRYGERLLYTAFNYALLNDLSAVYVQIRQGRHQRLSALLQDFGFREKGCYKRDKSYVKYMRPDVEKVKNCLTEMQRFDYAVDYYPYHIDGPTVRKFIVSLTESAHDALFPDAKIQLLALPSEDRPVIGDAHAIRKTFLHVGFMASMRPADLLFFYVKGSYGQVDCMGIVEDFYICPAGARIPDKFRHRVVNGMMRGDSERALSDVMIIRFRLVQYLERPILRSAFTAADFDVNHRSIRTIPERIYRAVLKPRLKNLGVS